jgi:peptidylprolyl isomerase
MSSSSDAAAAAPAPLRVERLAGDDLVKEVLAEGAGACPQVGDEVHAHYTGKLLDGSVFDSSVARGTPFTFTLGRGQVIRAWDDGFATMRRGERAVLQCAPSFGYGARGSPPKIPPNSVLRFEVELLSFGPKPKNLDEMGNAERLAEAAARKDAGNAAFTGGDVRLALEEWARGVDALKAGLNDVSLETGDVAGGGFEAPLEPAQREQLKALRVTLPGNKAMAELKLALFADAARSASEALAADPAHPKSLFRRGVARAALGELADARADLTAAAKLAPADGAVRAELDKVNKLLAAAKAKEKAIFGGWANKKGGLFGGDEAAAPAAAPAEAAAAPAPAAEAATAEGSA